MPKEPQAGMSAPTYVINRNQTNDAYTLWQLDLNSPNLLSQITINPEASTPKSQHLFAIGSYLMAFNPPAANGSNIDYRLFEFDPSLKDPLNNKAVQASHWEQSKFLGYYDHYTWTPDEDILQLIPITGYVLAYMPSSGRTSYRLWNFDPATDAPGSSDPLPNAMTPMDAFSIIGEDSQLLPIGNYVLEWIASSSSYRVWSFDPQAMTPLALPTIAEGSCPDISSEHQLLVMGEYILAWLPTSRDFSLWMFDPEQSTSPLVGPIHKGTLPESFDSNSNLTAVQSTIPVNPEKAQTPGTMDFMREKIEHVVVYMLESRSMDSVLGWLYENNPPGINYVDAEPPFKGTSTTYSNQGNGKIYPVYKFNGGELSQDIDLTAPTMDPFHGTPDSIHQQYSKGYPAYFAGETPDMGGFVRNNCSGDVMVTLTPKQLPVLNGLAAKFSVSDEWFSGLPGGTDSNRAFALTGSAFNITTTYEGNPQYEYFPDQAHRQSIWKVLWNNGISDWKIYWSCKWIDYVFTYQLYLKGDIPAVDANVADGKNDYVAPMSQFIQDAKTGTLPKFSFLEPYWIAPSGATSYHPGGNLVPAEKALYDIYEAIANGPGWEKTALVVTFSKGGGLYDHVPPSKAINPWPNDINDGFTYNVLGPRVPTIVVSPWVNENTVFRSPGETPLSATSMPATLLEWFGIPKARWGLGDRVPASETFEAVFQRQQPRTDKPTFPVPYDKNFPLMNSSTWSATPLSSEWNQKSNWNEESLPTDTATFSASSHTEITFSSNSDAIVKEITFSTEAPAYTFSFGSGDQTPALTISGDGISNHSANPQTFNIEATSKGPYDPQLKFTQSASAGGSNVFYYAGPESLDSGYGGGVISFADNSSAGSASFIVRTGAKKPPEGHTVGGEISFSDSSTADTATFTTYGTLGSDGYTFGNVVFHKSSTAAYGTFTAIGGTVSGGDGGNTQFYDTSNAASGTFINKGGTYSKANGGDTAFDGNAVGGFGCFYNHAAEAEYAYGGVTSFNNNPPEMPGMGASAGNATIYNYGAQDGKKGGGGHLSFSARYGSPTAADATVTNFGSDIEGKSSAGHTIFSIQIPTDYYPTAGNAVFHNKPALTKGAAAGYAEFSVYTAERGGSTVIEEGNIPTAGNATFFNYGATTLDASGGYTEFTGTTSAGNARLFAQGGENGGFGGTISFSDTSRAENASLVGEGGVNGGYGGQITFRDQSCGNTATVQLNGNSKLDISDHAGGLSFNMLDVVAGTIVMQLGSQVSDLTLNTALSFKAADSALSFEFKPSESFKNDTPYTILTVENLSTFKTERFTGNSLNDIKPTFSIIGDHLQVEFKTS